MLFVFSYFARDRRGLSIASLMNRPLIVFELLFVTFLFSFVYLIISIMIFERIYAAHE